MQKLFVVVVVVVLGRFTQHIEITTSSPGSLFAFLYWGKGFLMGTRLIETIVKHYQLLSGLVHYIFLLLLF